MSRILGYVLLYFVLPYLLLFTVLVYLSPVIAIWLIVHFWNKQKEKKIRATIAASPGSYCEECLCQLAGSTKDYPHLFSCSHSTELLIGEPRDEVVRRMQHAK